MIKISKFDEFANNLFSKFFFQQSLNSDNREEHKKNIKIINGIINSGLTEKQRKCLTMYYKKNMNTVEISRTLDICPSTVCRHIKKAKNKIGNILRYLNKID